MDATCPSCQTSYRVADEKVPEVGAQIKCPKCNSTFVVKKTSLSLADSSGPDRQPQAYPNQARVSTPAANMQATAPAAQPTPAQDLRKRQPASGPSSISLGAQVASSAVGEAEVGSGHERQVRGVSAIRAQSTVRSDNQTYRIRTPKGLTYDFQTRLALDQWLSEREDATGCEIAIPGQGWQAVESGGTSWPSQADSDSVRPTGGEHRSAESIKPLNLGESRPAVAVQPTRLAQDVGEASGFGPHDAAKAGLVLWLTIVISTLLLVFLLTATLTRLGVWDLSSYVPLSPMGIRFPAQVSAQKQVDSEKPVVQKLKPEELYRRASQAGKQALRRKRFSKAILEYKRALAVHPGSVEVLEGLSMAYKGLGDIERAKTAMEKARSIKAE